MRAIDYFKGYAERCDSFLADFFKSKTDAIDLLEQDLGYPLNFDVQRRMLNSHQEYMMSGKRVRGALVELGHDVGEIRGPIIAPSVGMELIHSFVLIHDDIMDQSLKRRGRTTLHEEYADWSRSQESHVDSSNYGQSIAMIVGDLAFIWGMELIMNSGFPMERKIRATRCLNQILQNTAYGQAFDVSRENLRAENLLAMYILKTANYTFTGPLQFGGVLGGASPSQLEAMRRYGNSIGIAFQLRDDELDLFGDEKVIGKDIGKDARTGKPTFIYLTALERATPPEHEILERFYGNPDVGIGGLDAIRDIMISSGALDHSRTTSRELIAKGVASIQDITDDRDIRETLESIAHSAVSRQE